MECIFFRICFGQGSIHLLLYEEETKAVVFTSHNNKLTLISIIFVWVIQSALSDLYTLSQMYKQSAQDSLFLFYKRDTETWLFPLQSQPTLHTDYVGSRFYFLESMQDFIKFLFLN